MKRRVLLVSAAATLAAPALVRAQAWPAQTIRVIHGYEAGSSPDTIARHLSGPLAEILGQQIVIEPRPGAAERLAATQVARLKPDGYTLYLMTSGQAVVSATDRTLSYDLLRDFEFISVVTRYPLVFVVAPDSRFKTVQAYVEEAKRTPDALTYGSAGIGSTLHMVVELMLAKTGARLTHVPYKGFSQPYSDLIAGRLDMQVTTFPSAQPLLKAGKLRAIAVTSKERNPRLPDVPTLAETLVPDYDVVSWLGLPRPPACRPPCAIDCTKPSSRRWRGRKSGPSWKSWATTRGLAHRLNFARGSKPTWRAGSRSLIS